jgi:radical SAM superfamily enzyme YgiQ (UPF0313 family)
MRVLLINPPIYDFAAFDMWARPAGLLYLAGALIQAGHDITLVDATWWQNSGAMVRRRQDGSGHMSQTELPLPLCLQNSGIHRRYKRYGLGAEEVARNSTGANPDVILVTSIMTYWYPAVRDTITALRAIHPGVPIVLGGIYATLLPEHALERCRPDAVLPGHRLRSIADDLHSLPGTPAVMPVPEQDSVTLEVPLPAFSAYDNPDAAMLFATLGCPCRCTWCAATVITRHVMFRPIADVIAEIQHLMKQHGMRHFAWLDDALLERPEVLEAVVELVRKEEVNLSFHTPNGLHAVRITKDMAMTMRAAGFRTVKIGDRRLGHLRRLDIETMTAAVDNLLSSGFDARDIGCYMLAGFPGHSVEQAREEVEELAALPVRTHVNPYSPVPGTPDFEQAMATSRIDLALEPIWQNTTLMPYWNPAFTPEDLQQLKKRGRK